MPKPSLVNKILLAGCWLLAACGAEKAAEPLPVLGPMELVQASDGSIDTLFTPYPWFAFEDQQGLVVNPDSLTGQVLLVDFFFSTCPTICKDLLSSLQKVYAVHGNNPQLRILSHSVDGTYDTREVLAAYAENAGATNRNWLFLRGDEAEVYNIAKTAYLSYVAVDSTAPGGFLHSGHLILLDVNRKIRGVYDGTSAEEVARLLQDLPNLLNSGGA